MGRAALLVALVASLATGGLADTWTCSHYYNSVLSLTGTSNAGKALLFIGHIQKDSQICRIDVRKLGSNSALEVCTNGPFGKYPRAFFGDISKDGSQGLAFWEDLDHSTTLYSVNVDELRAGSSRGIQLKGPIITGGALSQNWKTMVSTIQSSDPNNQGIVVTHLQNLGTREATALWPTTEYSILSLSADDSLGVGVHGGNGSHKHVEGNQVCLVHTSTIANGTTPRIDCTPQLPAEMFPWYPKISPDGKMIGWWVHENQHACFMTTQDLMHGKMPYCLKGPKSMRWETGVSYLTNQYAVLRGNCALDLHQFLKNNQTDYGCAEEIESPEKTPITPGSTTEDGSITWSWVNEGNTISSTTAYVCRSTLSAMVSGSKSETVCKNLKKYENSQYYHSIVPFSSTEAVVNMNGDVCYWKL